jgi:hypothetical protein
MYQRMARPKPLLLGASLRRGDTAPPWSRPTAYDPCVERVVVTAKLKLGSHEAAAELLRSGPPFDPAEIGLVGHGAYLGSSEVVFLFEGPDVKNRVRDLLNDRAVSASFAAWGPLVEGTPSAAHELFYWEAAHEDAESTTSENP